MSAVVPHPISTFRAARHLCAVDLRRFHWLVAGVVGIELVRALLVEGSLHLAPPTALGGIPQAGAEVAVPLLDLAITLMTALATAVLVQADHPTDDRAFWRTRPIPPLAVALAKVLSMTLLFVAVPAAINAVRLVAYGAPASAIAAATIQIAVLAGIVGIPAWFVAVLTRTLPRFLGAVLGVFIAIYFVAGTLAVLLGMMSRGPARGGVSVVPAMFDWLHTGTHGWWGGLVSIIGGAAILGAHYGLRRTKVTMAGLLLLIVIPSFVPARQPEQPAPADLASRVHGQLTLPEGLTAGDASSAGLMEPTVHVTGRIAMPPLPLNVSAGTRLDRVSVRSGDTVVPAEGREQCCAGKGAMGVVSAAAATTAAPNRRLIGNTSLEVFNVRASAVDALRRGPLDLEADVTVAFSRHRVAGALPLRPGASLRTDRYLVEVLAIESLRGQQVDYRASRGMVSVLVRFTRFPSMAGSGSTLDFFAADPSRQVAEFVRAPWPIATYNPHTTVDNFVMGRRWATRASILVEGGLLPPDADLVVVETTGIGTLHTRLKATGVPIRVAPMGAF